jgi:peptidoglycan/LPS O-acetylase OafA/YrhL
MAKLVADPDLTRAVATRKRAADSTCSIGSVLESRQDLGAGFDVLRIVLAYSVVAWHSIYIAKGVDPFVATHFVWFPGYAILSMFFALSGFLITASAKRLSLTHFIVNRGLRIIPALLVEVVLSAIVLGAVFTTLPLSEYFQSREFWRYFGNVAGFVHLTLPGVFQSNPDHSVNISLWTIPYEIGCYILMAALVLSKCLRRPRLVLTLCVAFSIVAVTIYLADPVSMPDSVHDSRQIFVGKGSRLFISFLLGVAFYLYRFDIEYNHRTAAACALLCLAVAAAGPFPTALLNVLVAPLLVYLTIYIGVTDLPKLPLFRRGDYSYGVYLYAYPLQQTLIAIYPLNGNALLLYILSLPFVTGFAMFSWHAIERPILQFRRRFSPAAETVAIKTVATKTIAKTSIHAIGEQTLPHQV